MFIFDSPGITWGDFKEIMSSKLWERKTLLVLNIFKFFFFFNQILYIIICSSRFSLSHWGAVTNDLYVRGVLGLENFVATLYSNFFYTRLFFLLFFSFITLFSGSPLLGFLGGPWERLARVVSSREALEHKIFPLCFFIAF